MENLRRKMNLVFKNGTDYAGIGGVVDKLACYHKEIGRICIAVG